jgi:hypothetical protein
MEWAADVGCVQVRRVKGHPSLCTNFAHCHKGLLLHSAGRTLVVYKRGPTRKARCPSTSSTHIVVAAPFRLCAPSSRRRWDKGLDVLALFEVTQHPATTRMMGHGQTETEHAPTASGERRTLHGSTTFHYPPADSVLIPAQGAKYQQFWQMPTAARLNQRCRTTHVHLAVVITLTQQACTR